MSSAYSPSQYSSSRYYSYIQAAIKEKERLNDLGCRVYNELSSRYFERLRYRPVSAGTRNGGAHLVQIHKDMQFESIDWCPPADMNKLIEHTIAPVARRMNAGTILPDDRDRIERIHTISIIYDILVANVKWINQMSNTYYNTMQFENRIIKFKVTMLKKLDELSDTNSHRRKNNNVLPHAMQYKNMLCAEPGFMTSDVIKALKC
jgi:hypothetical protein